VFNTFIRHTCDDILIDMCSMIIMLVGVIPEFIAKWISGHGIPPSYLCLSVLDGDIEEAGCSSTAATSSTEPGKHIKLAHVKTRSVSLSGNPIIS